MNLNNDNYKNNIIVISIFLFINFILLSLSLSGFLNSFYYFNDIITKNFRVNLYSLSSSINDFSAYIKNSSNIIDENKKLKRELASFQSLKEYSKILENQNKALNNESKFFDTKKLVLANIIYRNDNFDYIELDKGTNNSVKNGDIVIYNNIAIGRVINAYPESSKIELITSKTTNIPVIISHSGDSRTNNLVGDNSFFPLINAINLDFDVKVGDSVLTSKLGNIYPENLLIGYVDYLTDIPSQPYKSAKIRPAIDITILNQFFILKR